LTFRVKSYFTVLKNFKRHKHPPHDDQWASEKDQNNFTLKVSSFSTLGQHDNFTVAIHNSLFPELQ